MSICLTWVDQLDLGRSALLPRTGATGGVKLSAGRRLALLDCNPR